MVLLSAGEPAGELQPSHASRARERVMDWSVMVTDQAITLTRAREAWEG